MNKLCWDSDVFIHWIEKKDAAKIAILQPIVTAAQNGQVRIVASYLAFAEVVRCNGDQPMSEEEEERIITFFKHPFIEVRPLDRAITLLARSFCRAKLIERQEAKEKHEKGRLIEPPKINVNDAVHVATALHYGCDVLHTFDGDLMRFTEKFGTPRLKIEEPSYKPSEPLKPASDQRGLFDAHGSLDGDIIEQALKSKEGAAAAKASGSHCKESMGKEIEEQVLAQKKQRAVGDPPAAS